MSQSFKFFLLAIAQCFQINSHPKQQDNQRFQILFTPAKPGEKFSCTKRIINHINDAKKEIVVQAYSFTSYLIMAALIDAAKKDTVKVKIILDQDQLIQNKYESIIDQYEKAIQKNKNVKTNLSFWIDKVKENEAKKDEYPPLAHNKVIIIDDQKVFTGSFNFTIAAEIKNAENSILIHDTNIAKEYKKNF